MRTLKVLFLGKENDLHTSKALNYLKLICDNVQSHLGAWGQPLPNDAKNWKGDIIISYLSRWVVPEDLINSAKIAAINFHPASPDYPGIGCNNFALYDGAKSYGVTCHYMSKKVDTGAVIAVKDFPLFDSDDVKSLLERTYDFQLALYFDVINYYVEKNKFPSSSRSWTREAYSRDEFNQLFEINSEMDELEVNKRTRAVSFGSYQPYIMLHGKKFKYEP